MSLLHAHRDETAGLLGHAHETSTHAGHDPCDSHPNDASTAAHAPTSGSALDRLDPRSRVLAAVVIAMTIAALPPSLPALCIALAGAVLLVRGARLRLRPTLQRLAAIEGFVLMTVLLLPFTRAGTEIGSFAGFAISAEGSVQAAAILLKSSIVALALLALIGALDSVVFGTAMARLGLPIRLVQLYLFTIRYLDVLHREYRRLRLAMRARGFAMRAQRHCWTSLGQLVGMLLVRSVERSERILAAMRCRGFDGTLHSLVPEDPYGDPDRGFAASVALALAGLVALALIMEGRFS